MLKRPKKKRASRTRVETIVHTDGRRTNIPTAELETFLKQEDRGPRQLKYPRPSEQLYPRNPTADPQLVWRGKDEQDRKQLEVTVLPIYIQEKIHPKAIIEAVRTVNSDEVPHQATLFSDFNGIEFDTLVDFYRHEQSWSNRMILGDSLEVMVSLSEKEDLKGQVQMIYIDPPYGIRFGSNWQVSTRKRDVKDGKVEDATRQPEQIRAFRDTWELGIHSYLSYLRDRLLVSRALLTTHGSVFVQIGDQNVHLVRSVLDETFGAENYCAQIAFRKTTGKSSALLDNTYDNLLWYAKDRGSVKYRPTYLRRHPSDDPNFRMVELSDGTRRALTDEELISIDSLPADWRIYRNNPLTSQSASATTLFSFNFNGTAYVPGKGGWKTNQEGMTKLAQANRLQGGGKTLGYVRFFEDFPYQTHNDIWDDTRQSGFGEPKLYAVQTATRVIERCLLMTTVPGDLVLDPTCGSGTTAYVSELWGRRWITIDTSRVALALSRTRLMTARFPYFLLADEHGRDLRHGFQYATVPHITLKSIANNPDIREGMTRAQIAAAVSRHAETETLYDHPDRDKSIVRVTGPFTVESLSPLLGRTGANDDATLSDLPPNEDARFENVIIDNLRTAGVQNTVRKERLTFTALQPWAGRFIHAVGDYTERDQAKRAAICIGPQFGTVDADLVRDAAKEAAGFFDVLIVCGFAFDAYIANEFKQLGNLPVLKANMNPDLSMGGDLLKKTGSGNLFTVFGEPDIEVQQEAGRFVVRIRGLDVFDPTTGEIRSHTVDEIACWFIDTDYNAESFFVRHAYFTGAGDPYGALKRALKADIDEEAWASLYSTKSRPFAIPKGGKIAVKVINHYGDEVMKVYSVADEVKYPAADSRPLLKVAEKPHKAR